MKTIITLLALVIAFGLSGQNIIVVDNNPGAAADYTTLQDAINNSDDGDFIYLIPSSTSYGNASASSEIHLRGLGHLPIGTNGLTATVGSLSLNTGSSNSSVSGVNFLNNINGGGSSNVTISNCKLKYMTVGGDNWVIEGSVIDNIQGNVQAIRVNNHENVTIHHNFIRHISDQNNTAALGQAPESTLEYNNIYVLDEGRLMWSCTNIEFQNSIILSLEEGDNLNFQGSSGWTFNNCLSYNYNGFAVPLTGTGENNLEDTNPQFENLQDDIPLFSYNNNYTPAAGSPLIEAGSDGDNIGIYNDNFNFDQRGHAIDLPYITTIDILNPSVEAGEELEVDFSAFGN